MDLQRFGLGRALSLQHYAAKNHVVLIVRCRIPGGDESYLCAEMNERTNNE